MTSKKLSIERIAVLNLKSRRYRTIGLVLLVTVLAFVLFGGSVLTESLNNGLNSMKQRFGADIMVVPMGYDGDLEAMLLKGEPCSFYLDKDVVDAIRKIEGVKQVSYQFFFVSTGADCCDFPVQIIGYDPSTDFTVAPWISQVYRDDAEEEKDNIVVIGNGIKNEEGESILLYGHEYYVSAKLQKTGTGLDYAVFADKNTLEDLVQAAEEKGFSLSEDVNWEKNVSSIFVEVEDGYEISAISLEIRNAISGVNTITTQNMISDTADTLESLVGFINIFVILLVLLTIVTLLIIFSVTGNERKKEFGIWRTIGATKKRLAEIILTESLIISVAGAVAGILLAAGIIFPFNTYLEIKLQLPYLQPTGGTLLLLFLISFLVSGLAGPVSTILVVAKISRIDTYLVMREGE